MTADPTLPDYREQTPEVAARFERLLQRPVALEVPMREIGGQTSDWDGLQAEAWIKELQRLR